MTNPIQIAGRGADNIAGDRMVPFDVRIPHHCDLCHSDVTVAIHYSPAAINKALGDIKVTSTILKDTRNWIGVTCGCYGKLHRQVAHIKDRREGRSKKP